MNNYNGVRHELAPAPDCGEAGHAEGACGNLQCLPSMRRVLVVDMMLHCPACHAQHVDAAPWDTRPHRSHLCHSCGHIWRPADVCTNGVPVIRTRGKNDSPLLAASPEQSAEPHAELRKTWKPGQRWQFDDPNDDYGWMNIIPVGAEPNWRPKIKYRRHPNDKEAARPALSDKQIQRIIYEHTKLNVNLRDDVELVGYIVNAVRAAIEQAVRGGGE